VDIWNSLEEDTVACDSLNGFKSRIDKILPSRGLYKGLFKASFPLISTELN
jgi:hypothetical protein